MAESGSSSLFDLVPDPVSRLREKVELLAAPAEVQIKWLAEEGLDADELTLLFLDIVPGWIPALRDAGVITPDAETALADLEHAANDLMEKAGPPLMTDDAVRTADEWQRLRALAATASEKLDQAPA